MDGQFTSSGFQLYGQPLQAPVVQQQGQQLSQNPAAQQVGGYTLIPTATGTGQPTLANLRNAPVQILQQPAAAQGKQQQQTGLSVAGFQPQPNQAPQQTQQRLPTAQVQGLTHQQLQYLQAGQQTGQLTAAGFQPFSQGQQLGAIQILQPKAQQGGVAGRGFQQAQQPQQQQPLQGIQVMTPQQAPQSLQQGQAQALQGLQGIQQSPGLQIIPGVNLFPGLAQQQQAQQQPQQQQPVQAPAPPKQSGVAATGFSPPLQHQLGPAHGTGSGHHMGSLFSNSNQRGGYMPQPQGWSDRERPERSDLRGRPRDRGRRDDRSGFGSRPGAKEPLPRAARDRDTFRHDRGNRDRFERNFRDYGRRERDRKPSPLHHHYEVKKEEPRKEPVRDAAHKPFHRAITAQETKAPAQTVASVKPAPVADYIVRVPQVPFATYERDYSEIARRYTHLHISPDFTRLVCHWAKADKTYRHPYGSSLCTMNKPVKFEMVQGPLEADLEIVLPAARNETSLPIRWNAKCTFLCGLDDKAHSDLLKGKFEGGTHLMNALKFVTVREEKDKKKTGIMCLGGPYDAAIDGGNPEQSDEGLKKACVRHVKAQTMLDLTPCSTWIRFCDVHYSRLDSAGGSYEEVTVIFLVDVSEIIPSAENWPAVWKEQTEWKKRTAQADIIHTMAATEAALAEATGKEPETVHETSDAMKIDEPVTQETPVEETKVEDAPKEVSVLLKCRSAKNGRVKTMSISLDGLLDYDENDKDEATFELSLMAENFNEMLMKDYGLLILNALKEHKRLQSVHTADEKKRPVGDTGSVTPEHPGKKQKPAEMPTVIEAAMDDQKPGDETTEPEAMDVQYPDSPGDVVHVGDLEALPEVKDVVTEQASALGDVMETDMHVTPPPTNEDLLLAFRFFDRAGCGFIKCDDLRRLLHNLGCFLAPRVVRELVHGAAAMNKEKPDRLYYRSLTDGKTSIAS